MLKIVADLQTQKTSVNLILQALKTKIAADVAADTWIKSDFVLAGKNLTMKEAIATKLTNIKTELIAIKQLVMDPAYETEIQAVINTL